MYKLITLGCSLTHHAGWAQYLNECTKYPLNNFAQSAGSNQLQQRKIQNYILRNGLDSSDIIIWQITSTERWYKRLLLDAKTTEKLKYYQDNPDKHPTLVLSEENIIDGISRVDELCNSVFDDSLRDEAQNLEDLLFFIVSIRKFTPNVFVFLGWKEAIPLVHQDAFAKLLKKFDIKFIDVPLVDWCKDHNYNFDLLLHPTTGSSSKYARDVLIPALEKQLNIKLKTNPIWAD